MVKGAGMYGLALLLLIAVTGIAGDGCQTYGTKVVCSTCQMYSFQTNADCAACPVDHCEHLNCDNGTCTKCQVGYYLDSGKCKACLPYCKDCGDGKKCTTCFKGYLLNIDKDKCKKCNGECTDCSTGRAECKACKEGTFLPSTAVQKCGVVCPSNCPVCQSSSNCSICTKGYYLSGASCFPCLGGCTNCSSDVDCKECPTNKYWDKATKTCKGCDVKCAKCDLNNKCTACETGYFLEGDKCIEAKHCTKSENTKGCTACEAGYHKKDKGCTECPAITADMCNKCVESNRGRIFEGDLCQYCPMNCLNCNTTTNCYKCLDNFLLNSTTNTCVACPTANSTLAEADCNTCSGSYFDGSCAKCSSNPTEVTLTGCTKCPGLYKGTTECKTNCSTATTEDDCTSCASAKVGYYWDSTCKEYNCSDSNTKAKCESCGSNGKPNFFQECKSCPSNPSDLSEPDECNECKNFFWNGTGCIDKTAVTCTGDVNTQVTCLFCGDHYYDTTVNATRICTGTLSEQACGGCNNRYWDSSCKTIDCATGTLNTAVKCNACNYLLKYWNGTTCAVANCTNADEKACTACQGMDFNNDTQACENITGGVITEQLNAERFAGRYWNSSNECLAVVAGVGLTMIDKIKDGGNYYSPTTLYRNPTTGKFESAECDDFSTEEECSKCDGQYWSSGDSACKALDCSKTSTLTNTTCYGCPGKYWTGTACVAVADCSVTTLSADQCKGCRWYGRYYNDSKCEKNAACSTTPTLETECNACEGYYWNSTTCSDVTDDGELATGEGECRGLWARYWKHTNKCLSVSHKLGKKIGVNMPTFTPTSLLERYVDESGVVYTSPPEPEVQEYKVSHYWCKKGPSNRYWKTTNYNAADCKATASICSSDTLRKTHPLLCSRCEGYIWDTDAVTCKTLDCSKPQNIDNQLECEACGQGFVFEKLTTGWQCSNIKAVCDTAILDTKDRCTACSTAAKPRYLKSVATCYACPANCKKCNHAQCLDCNAGYFWDGAACTSCGTTDSTKQKMGVRCDSCVKFGTYKDAGVCKNCPDTKCKTCPGGKCQECKTSYILYNDVCTWCTLDKESCTTCTTKITTQGSYWTGSSCAPCSLGCSSCTAADKCTECLHQMYYLDASSCKPCNTAVNDVQCKSCNGDNYRFVSMKCSPCVSNCGTCAATGCTKCEDGYFMDDNKKCKPCGVKCNTCKSNKDCTKCEDNYYLDIPDTKTNLGICAANPANCKVVKDKLGCTECDPLYVITGKLCELCEKAVTRPNCATCQDTTHCKTCKGGYGLTSSGECKDCTKKVTNCLACHFGEKSEGGTFCDTCKANFCWEPKSKECVEAIGLNCKTCTKTGTTVNCIECLAGKTKEVCKACPTGCAKCTKDACSDCKTGYEKDSNNVCIAKVCTTANCAKCSTAAVCTVCKPGYILQDGICILCTANCETCASNTTCTTCKKGFKTTAVGVCIACSTRCDACTNDCIKCITATDKLSNGVCTSLSTTTPTPSDCPKNVMALSTLLAGILVVYLGHIW